MMSFKKNTLVILSVGVFGSLPGAAHGHDMPAPKPSTAEFNQVQQLTGKWSGTESHPGSAEKPSPVTTEFRGTSAGSAIEEVLMRGTPHEMVDMYSDEGGKLGMVHYCALGNQPHMQLQSATPKSI